MLAHYLFLLCIVSDIKQHVPMKSLCRDWQAGNKNTVGWPSIAGTERASSRFGSYRFACSFRANIGHFVSLKRRKIKRCERCSGCLFTFLTWIFGNIRLSSCKSCIFCTTRKADRKCRKNRNEKKMWLRKTSDSGCSSWCVSCLHFSSVGLFLVVGVVREVLMDVVLPSLVAGSAENVAQEAFESWTRLRKGNTEPKMRNLKHLKEKTITLRWSDHCYCCQINQITEKTGEGSGKAEKKNERQ